MLTEQGNFNWAMYEDGYNGRNLTANKKVKTKDKKTIVYSHEDYAVELFNKYSKTNNDANIGKDLVRGSSMNVIDMKPYSEHEVLADVEGGGSLVIDLNKERDYIRCVGYQNVTDFLSALSDNDKKQEIFNTVKPSLTVLSADKISLMEGYRRSMEQEMLKSISTKDTAYYAEVVGNNNGGAICNICGVRCFLPSSEAAQLGVSDYSELIGQTIPVMIISYVYGQGFYVSYKSYVSKVIPNKIAEELSINMHIVGCVTGTSKNGIFISFKDKEGAPIFNGLIYRDNMSEELEEKFDLHKIHNGMLIECNIYKIEMFGDKFRINLSDMDIESNEFKHKQEKVAAEKEQKDAQRDTQTRVHNQRWKYTKRDNTKATEEMEVENAE